MELVFEVQGKKVKVQAQILNQQLWIHFNGKTFVVETNPKKKLAARGGPGGSSDVVKAPMPGKVTKILVKSGDLVEKGQTVLVMEAMKMEYTLKAEISGKIASIDSQVGDQVQVGKTLIKLEPGK